MRMFLPPGPIKAPILSGSIFVRINRGAQGEISSFGREMVVSIFRRISIRASRDWAIVARMISSRDAADLQIQLNAGDAVLRSGDLEVHVTEVIFVADDVGQQDPVVADSWTSPTEIPATGLLIGTPADIRPSVAPQTEAIDDEPFDSRMSEMMRTV